MVLLSAIVDDTNIKTLGLLYISASNATASNLVSVTWDAPAITAALTTTTNATLLKGTLAGSLYAVTSSGSYDPAGIVPSTGLNSSINATTLGFGMFGSQVVLNSAGSILASFYAKTVSDDVWALEWNSDNTDSDDATPVAINTNAPAIPATQVAEDAKGNS